MNKVEGELPLRGFQEEVTFEQELENTEKAILPFPAELAIKASQGEGAWVAQKPASPSPAPPAWFPLSMCLSLSNK